MSRIELSIFYRVGMNFHFFEWEINIEPVYIGLVRTRYCSIACYYLRNFRKNSKTKALKCSNFYYRQKQLYRGSNKRTPWNCKGGSGCNLKNLSNPMFSQYWTTTGMHWTVKFLESLGTNRGLSSIKILWSLATDKMSLIDIYLGKLPRTLKRNKSAQAW